MEPGTIALMATAAVAIIVALVGAVKWGVWYTKAEQAVDLAVTFIKAGKDKVYTNEEIADIEAKLNILLGKE
jgi:hypothetical protein